MLQSVNVISDVVCPWCFIGKRHLEAALAEYRKRHPEQAPAVHWHAFQLNPDLPRSGADRKTYLERKFGGPQRAAEIYARVSQAGQRAGLDFQFDRILMQPNTVQAHRLIARAADDGTQDAMVEALFRAYFLDGRNLTDDAVLAELAEGAGLDRDAAVAFLASDALTDRVADDAALAQRIGVQGVPFFIFDGRLACSGAQPPEVLVEAMEEAAAMPAEA